jgi:hypothetical protein
LQLGLRKVVVVFVVLNMCWGEWVGVYIWLCILFLVLVCCWNIGHVQWREEWPIERLVVVMVVVVVVVV